MRVEARHAAAAMAVMLLVCAAWGVPLVQSQKQKPAPKPQQAAQPADQQQPQPDQQPPPGGPLITGGPAKMKSSRQGKATASAGFNGVDPATDKVKDDVIKASPTAEESAKAMQLSVYGVSDADVQAFAKEGNLNLAPVPAKAGK